MSTLFFDRQKCDLCGLCIEVCPFKALEQINGVIEVNAACKMCKICINKCPQAAIAIIDEEREKADTSKWKGILIYAEHDDIGLHPVTLELIGEARKLASKIDHPVYALIIGDTGVAKHSDMLIEHGVDKVFIYEHSKLKHFRADNYTNVFEDCINKCLPTAVLIGATPLGRSLAPRVSTRFRTGLTADCTELQMRENTDLVQIRPAFGGNVMAQIITPDSRPQFATVRYKVMDRAEIIKGYKGEIVKCTVTPEMLQSRIEVVNSLLTEKKSGIEEAEIIVVAGRGFKSPSDLAMLKELADLLGAEMASSRPLVENGWVDKKQQIGLSGKTVKPKLIITFGVSGSIQFRAGMQSAECIIVVNNDKNAPIFDIAHYCVVGDLYEILPGILEQVKKGAVK
jgi:electron transfer flavoprotein alpha subunit